MRTRAALVLLAVALLCTGLLGACTQGQCNSVASIGTFGAFLVDGANAVLNDFTVSDHGVDEACGNSPAPPTEDQALSPGEVCAADPTEDSCVACAKGSCCAASLTCFGEHICTCLVACGTAGCSSDEAASCGAKDAAYAAELACISDHCAAECPAGVTP
jgi:hypothetical protein